MPSLRDNLGPAEKAVLIVVLGIFAFAAWVDYDALANDGGSDEPNLADASISLAFVNPILLMPAVAFAAGMFIGDRVAILLLPAIVIGAIGTDLVTDAFGLARGEFPLDPARNGGSSAIECILSNGGLAALGCLGLL